MSHTVFVWVSGKKSKKSRATSPVLWTFHHVGHQVGGRVLQNHYSHARI